ncbi:MAG TPA: peptide chain release factor N(5)-glutamine methyltransferase [Rhizomicrobium sp.]|nr:peptide chain release factor N(5)-glutamine methyltransferase [Rhizomicrobium sp.]
MNTRDALTRGAEQLRAAGIESARLDARVLMAHVLGVETNEIPFYPPLEGGSKNSKNFSGRGHVGALKHDPSPKFASQISTLPQGEGEVISRFDYLIARRAAREPVAYLIGKKEFWSRDFAVGPGALVPRPETETLIEEILRQFPDRSAPLKILDLGTGTGCILITLLHEYPNARGLGVDASQAALFWARRNAAGLESRCELRLADWEKIEETGFDIVVSNPPYLSATELEQLQPEVFREPREALAGGADGLDAYRSLAACAPGFLAPSGCAVFEIGAGQGEGVSAILRSRGLEIARLTPDLSDIPRCIVAHKAG